MIVFGTRLAKMMILLMIYRKTSYGKLCGFCDKLELDINHLDVGKPVIPRESKLTRHLNAGAKPHCLHQQIIYIDLDLYQLYILQHMIRSFMESLTGSRNLSL